MATVADIVKGAVVRLSTLALNDSNIYQGAVIGEGNSYEVAKSYGDIVTYNNNVPGNLDLELLDFFILKLSGIPEGPQNKFAIAIAKEWVNESTLTIIATQKRLYLTVYDVDIANSQDVIDTLKAANFKAIVTGHV